MTLMNNKANNIFQRLDAETNGKKDSKIGVQDLQKAQAGSDGDLKDMANYIFGHKDFAKALGLDLSNKKSAFSTKDVENAVVQGKFNATADDFNNAANDYDKMNAAMSIISQHKDELDAATHDNVDDNFDISDFYNGSKSSTTPQDFKDATAYVAGSQGLLRDIDGHLDKTKDGISDGKFSWDEFQNAQKHAVDSNYKFTGYDGDVKAPITNGVIDHDTKQQDTADCQTLSTLKSISETDKGKILISKATKKAYDDGSVDIEFVGNPGKTYHVTQADINSTHYAKGDRDMQLLTAAIWQYAKDKGIKLGNDHVDKNGNPSDDQGSRTSEQAIYQLLDGGQGRASIQAGKGHSPNEIKKYLIDSAPHLGKDLALTLAGKIDDHKNWKAAVVPDDDPTGHIFQISNIDTATEQVTYTNPLDTSVKRTISIDDLATQMSDAGGFITGRNYSP